MAAARPATVSAISAALDRRREAARQRALRLRVLARATGPLDLALGQALLALCVGNRLSQEGGAKPLDFAREHLDLDPSTFFGLMRVARELRHLPRLRSALQAGVLTYRQVLTVLPLSSELPDAILVKVAVDHTVREVERMVKALGRSTEETFQSAVLFLTPEQQARADEALATARILEGAGKATWRLREHICQEYANLGTTSEPGAGPSPDLHVDVQGWLQAWRCRAAELAAIERELPARSPATPANDDIELSRFDDLPAGALDPDTACLLGPVLRAITEDACLALEAEPGPGSGSGAGTGSGHGDWDVDVDVGAQAMSPLRRHLLLLARARALWGLALGRVARAVRVSGDWRTVSRTWAGFCEVQLGMHRRTVGQRIRFEEALIRWPPLLEAVLAGHIGYSKGQIVAREATPATIHGLLAEAREVPCLDLKRRADANVERRSRERGRLPVTGPQSALALMHDVIAAAQAAAQAAARKGEDVCIGPGEATAQAAARKGEDVCIGPGEAWARVCDHFVAVWKEEATLGNDRRTRVLTRNEGLCLVPGCSYEASHMHHIIFESHGGPTEDWNLAGLCPSHHLHCLHVGYLRISGRADGVLVFELGLRNGRPVEVYRMAAGDLPRRLPRRQLPAAA